MLNYILNWTRIRQPTPVFLPGKVHAQSVWEDYSPWGHKVGHDLVQDWELMYTRGRFMSMYGKTNTVLQRKIQEK